MLVGLYAAAGFLGVPPLTTRVLAPRLSERLHGEIEIGAAEFNPFTLHLVVRDVTIRDENGERFASIEFAEGNFQLVSTILEDGWRFAPLRVESPSVRLVIEEDGSINLPSVRPADGDDEPSPGRDEPMELPRLVVETVELENATLEFRDERFGASVEKRIADLDVGIARLDTAPAHGNEHSLELAFDNGGALSWTGSLYADPLTATGRLTVDAVDLTPLAPYLRRYTDARLALAEAHVELSYDLAPVADPPRASVDVATASLRGLTVRRHDQPIVDVPSIEATNARIDVAARTLRVETIAVDSADATVRRSEEGELELATILTLPEGERAEPPTEVTASWTDSDERPGGGLIAELRSLARGAVAPWDVRVEEATVANTRLALDDRSPREPVGVIIEDVTLEAGPIATASDYRTPFSLSGVVHGADRVSAKGEVRPLEPFVTAHLRAEGADLAWLSPYLPEDLPGPLPPSELRSAAASVDATATLAREGGVTRIEWSGSAGLASLEIVRAQGGSPVVAAGEISTDLDASAALSPGGLQRLDADGSVDSTSLSIDAPLRGPIEASAASLALSGALRATGDAGAGLSFEATGDVTGADLSADAPEISGLSADVGAATATGVSLDGDSLSIEEALIEAPRVSARAPLLAPPPEEIAEMSDQPTAAPTEPSPTAAPTTDAAADPGFALTVGSLGVREGRVELNDRSGERTTTVVGERVSIDVDNLANDGETVSDVSVDFRLSESGKTSVTGRVDPFRSSPFADLTIELSSVPIPPYDPFIVPALGYRAASGRLAATIPVTIEDGQVEGRLDARLRRFYLGDRVDMFPAPNAPIRLGLDLLRSGGDVIRLDVPFSAGAEGLTPRLGKVITRAAVNTVGGIATAPFRALASIFAGGKNVDLSRIIFPPGSTEPSADMIDRLDLLGEALHARPELELTVVGHAHRDLDAPALRERTLRDRLLQRLRESRAAAASLDEETERAMVAEAFAERFPARRPVPVPPGARNQRSHAQMRRALLDTIEISDERLLTLARARAQAAAAEIERLGEIPEGRLLIAEPTIDDGSESDQPRVTFELEGD